MCYQTAYMAIASSHAFHLHMS